MVLQFSGYKIIPIGFNLSRQRLIIVFLKYGRRLTLFAFLFSAHFVKFIAHDTPARKYLEETLKVNGFMSSILCLLITSM